MKRFKSLIDSYSAIAPQYKSLHVYINNINKNQNSHPDVAIETCKSMLESLSKLIMTDIKGFSEAHYYDQSAGKLVKDANAILKAELDSYDNPFIDSFSTIASKINELRNSNGDICHGRLHPKAHYGDVQLSTSVIGIVEIISIHMLRGLMNRGDIQKEVEYSDNEAFNDFLDEINEEITIMSRNIRFSKALFELDFYEYKEQLEVYLENIDGHSI